MTEPDDALLGAEFVAYRETLVPAVHPAGPAAARATVRRRRRRAAVATAAAVVIAVAVPVAGQAAFRDRPAPPTGPAQTAEPTPSVTPSPAPLSPSPTPNATSATSATPAAPDGRISREQLLAARIDLPAWRPGPSCPDRNARLTGTARADADNELAALDHGDLDGDGADETVVLVRCVLGTGGPAQVVALDRDDRGRIVTLGQVVRSDIATPQWLDELDVRDDGTIRVRVADLAPGGGWSLDWSQRQWRSYRWDGKQFDQTAGPTSFGPNPHLVDVGVSAEDLAWEPADAQGVRSGTLRVVVRNDSERPAETVELRLDMEPGLQPEGVGWPACVPGAQASGDLLCRLGPLAPGEARALRLGLRDRSTTSGIGIASVEPVGSPDDPRFDPDREDNEERFVYR